MSKKSGIALVVVIIFIVALTGLAAAISIRTIGENRILQHYTESTQAFWLAEAGANRALDRIRQNPSLASGTNLSLTALGPGKYNFDLVSSAGNYTVTARGCIPAGCDCNPATCRVIRTLAVGMFQLSTAPANFYNNAVYVSGNVSKGKTIVGNMVYGGTNTSGVTPVSPQTFIKDASATPLPLLDFEQLRTISQSQLHYNPDVGSGNTWPTSFWYEPPSVINPLGTPNVVFVEGNFSIKGNNTAYGFIVVGGEVSYDATIAGTSSVVGSIYTRGNFTISGGGNALNIDGGVWAGGSADLGGNGKINFNSAYMNAIQGLGITTDVQINSWQDTQNPYNLTAP